MISINKDDAYTSIQNALDQKGEVVIPAGKYTIAGTLTIHSDTTLRLEEGAEFFWADGNGKDASCFMLICDRDSENITVEGGIWDANADGNPRNPASGYLGVMMRFVATKNLTLKNMTVRNSDSFHIQLNHVEDFLVENITYDDNMIRFNQDGIHISGGCKNGTIKTIRAVGQQCVNDDLIAIISDLNFGEKAVDDPDIDLPDGPISDIHISDVQAENTFSFLRLLSVEQPIRNISMCDVSGGCFYIGVQMQLSPYLRGPQYGSRYFGVGNIENITFKNWNVRFLNPRGVSEEWKAAAKAAVRGLIEMEEGVKNLQFESFRRDFDGDEREDMPTLLIDNESKNFFTYPDGTTVEKGDKLSLNDAVLDFTLSTEAGRTFR